MSSDLRSLGHGQAEADGEAGPTDSAALGDTKIADGVQCPVLVFYRILVLEILILAKSCVPGTMTQLHEARQKSSDVVGLIKPEPARI